MGYYILHWHGGSDTGAPSTSFDDLLDELDVADEEHGDVSVVHDSEWGVSINRSRHAWLESIEPGAPEPVHMGPLGRSVLLELMRGVAEGRAQEMLTQYPWLPGYPRAAASQSN